MDASLDEKHPRRQIGVQLMWNVNKTDSLQPFGWNGRLCIWLVGSLTI